MSALRYQLAAALQRCSANIKNNTLLTHSKISPLLRLQSTNSSTHFTAFLYNGKDPGPLFLDHHVNKILRDLTGCDHGKIFKHKKIGPISAPRYEFLTTEQLEQARASAATKATELLQMPPVMNVRSSDVVVIHRDPALQGFNEATWIFTDISLGVADRKRLIVARDKDGTLRHATEEERHRMNQIYNPRNGRTLGTPKVFTAGSPEQQDVLSRGEYEFLLDRACVQMEPDNRLFQTTAAATYIQIDKYKHYAKLLSTRHYGPMLFFLTWHRMLDGMIEDALNREALEETAQLVRLHMLIHADSKTAVAAADTDDNLHTVKMYVAEDAKNRPTLLLAVKVLEEVARDKQQFEAAVRLAHGVAPTTGVEA